RARGRVRLPIQEDTVRRLIQWTLVPVAFAAIACKSDKPTQAGMSDELKKDLQLASATQNIRISPDEISPKSQLELTVRPKKAPSGPKVIRSTKPTVKASPRPVQVAEAKNQIPQMEVMTAAPAPSETPTSDSPPLARPASLPAPSYPGAAPIPGNGSGGVGGVIAGVFGAVIRGGAVGDDDHCDPRHMPRGRPVGGDIYGRPVFGPLGGMGGTRMPPPMVPRGRSLR
ncbi:MAG TPA: hypothetical protein VH559_05795, partial [Gemmatimonadaceae bacterium]